MVSLKNKVNDTKEKIKVGKDEYTLSTTEKGEQCIYRFDNESKKEIRIIFSNESVGNITNQIIETLSYQYINRIVNS